MLRILILALLFIGLYRFIIRFVLPVLRVTGAVRKQMKHMQQAGEPGRRQQAGTAKSRSKPVGDYIDYEEVR